MFNSSAEGGSGGGYWGFSQSGEVIQRARTRAAGSLSQSGSEKVLGTLIWKVKQRPECTHAWNPLSYWGHTGVKQMYWTGAEGFWWRLQKHEAGCPSRWSAAGLGSVGPTFCCFDPHQPGLAFKKAAKYMWTHHNNVDPHVDFYVFDEDGLTHTVKK